MSFLERLRAGLRRTTDQLVGRFDRLDADPATRVGVRPAAATASLDTLDTLEEILIEADIGVSASRRLLDRVRDHTGDADLRSVVKHELRRLLDAPIPAPVRGGCPRVVLVVGVNGTGKTTTVGRLARLLALSGQQPVICAADTFRAAAVEQLQVWARRAEADFVRARPGADPAAVVFDAISAGKARGRDVVLVDTAGRAPHETLLVLDATVGQNGLAQAQAFLEAVGVTGVVLTKLDGTAKGGIAVAITAELGVPIRYVGVGEQLDDLVPFSAAEYVEALFEPAW